MSRKTESLADLLLTFQRLQAEAAAALAQLQQAQHPASMYVELMAEHAEMNLRADLSRACVALTHATRLAMATLSAPAEMAALAELRRTVGFGTQINRLCGELPEGAEVTIECERGAGSLKLALPDGRKWEPDVEARPEDWVRLALAEAARPGSEQPSASERPGCAA